MRLYIYHDNTYFKEQRKVAAVSFATEFINLVLVSISAVMAASMLVWADAVLSLAATAYPLLLLIVLSTMMHKDHADKYNYGTARIETLTSLCCDVLVVFGLFATCVASIPSILRPEPPQDGLLLFVILKVINLAVDLVLLFGQLKLRNMNKGELNNTVLAIYVQNTVSDSMVLVAGLACYLLVRFKWSWYISPVVAIVMGIVFIVSRLKHLRQLVGELVDASAPFEDQQRVFDLVLDDHDGIKRVHAVNMHSLNQVVHVDVDVDFKPETTYAQQQAWIDGIYEKVTAGQSTSYRVFLKHESEKSQKAHALGQGDGQAGGDKPTES